MYKLTFILLAIFCLNECFAQGMEEGAPITSKVSPSFSIPGRTIKLSGTTVVGKSAVNLSLTITDPKGSKENVTLTTDTKGNYNYTFTKANTTGWYAFTVVTADKKNSVTDSLNVTSITSFSYSFAGKMARFTVASQQAITSIQDKTSGLPTSAELTDFKEKSTQLTKKLNELRKNVDDNQLALVSVLKEINDVPKSMEKADAYLQQMDDWNENAQEQLATLEKQLAASKAKASTCDNLSNITELFGAISLCMNFQGKFLQICTSLASDKLIPGVVDRQSWNGDNAIVEAKKATINQTQKTLFAKSQGASAVAEFITKGMVLDMAQFVSKVLYAQMCTEIKGPANATFNAAFDADNGAKYWTYGLKLNGNLTLRYDKAADLSKAVAVTGEFEGVRTNYTFWEDFKQIEKVPKGMMLYARIKKSPLPIDVSAIGNDLGMIARNLVPGSYRVKVKGKVVNNTLTLEFDDSPFDAIETARNESNKLFVICVNPILPIPMVKRFDFPIASSKVVLIRSLGKTHDFTLKKSGDKVTIKDNVSNKVELDNNSVHLSSSLLLDVSN
jgi:hypothetical protein